MCYSLHRVINTGRLLCHSTALYLPNECCHYADIKGADPCAAKENTSIACWQTVELQYILKTREEKLHKEVRSCPCSNQNIKHTHVRTYTHD